jgi:hypothetical protein
MGLTMEEPREIDNGKVQLRGPTNLDVEYISGESDLSAWGRLQLILRANETHVSWSLKNRK